jgi:hypothetical protein
MVKVGQAVTFVDAHGKTRPALVLRVHGNEEDDPSINLIYVSGDKSRGDMYGRQIERETSVVHQRNQSSSGMYWRQE